MIFCWAYRIFYAPDYCSGLLCGLYRSTAIENCRFRLLLMILLIGFKISLWFWALLIFFCFLDFKFIILIKPFLHLMLTCRTYVCFCALSVLGTHCYRLIPPPVLEFVPHRWFSPLCFHKIGVRIFPGAWRTRENCKIAPRGDLVVCILSCCLKNEVNRISEERKCGFFVKLLFQNWWNRVINFCQPRS